MPPTPAASWRGGTATISTRSWGGAATTRSSRATTWSWEQSDEQHGDRDEGEERGDPRDGPGGQGCRRQVGASRPGGPRVAAAGAGRGAARAVGARRHLQGQRGGPGARQVGGRRLAAGQAP